MERNISISAASLQIENASAKAAIYDDAMALLLALCYQVDYRTGAFTVVTAPPEIMARSLPQRHNWSIKNAHDYIHPEDVEGFLQFYDLCSKGEPGISRTIHIRILVSADPIQYKWHYSAIVNKRFSSGSASIGFGVLQNIDEQVRRELCLRERARRDSLTGLLNHGGMMQTVEESISKPGSEGGILMMLDIDKLKQINDTYGHPVGDRALILTARAIETGVEKDDYIGRIGGDEFMVFIKAASADSLNKRICDMRKQLAALLAEAEMPFCVNFSAGYAAYEDGDTFESLYIRADKALYRSKAECSETR